jgi:alpha-galactosidase
MILHRRANTDEPQLSLRLSLREDQPFALASFEMANDTGSPIRIHAFHVLDNAAIQLGRSPIRWRFYKHGWQSWSPTLVLPCSGEDITADAPVAAPGTKPPAAAGRFLSELVTSIVDPSTCRGITAGFISSANQFSQVWLDRDQRRFTAASYADGIEVAPSEAIASEVLLIEPTADPDQALHRYGAALGRQMNAMTSHGTPTGWCSWYYYWQGVSEEAVLRNLEFLADRRDELPTDYVQIDDGYQANIGDWLTPNEKFPRGMAWLAERIHRRGFKAGLWLAPFLMGEESDLWRRHPNWAVHTEAGEPTVAIENWGQRCYALDLTRPDVIEWLDDVFTIVSRDWGFDYVKIDFIYAGAIDGVRRDRNVTRAQAYRRGLEAVRQAVGDRFVLACGAPIGPSIGLVDAARIGPDVAPYWKPFVPPSVAGRSSLSLPSALNSIRNTLTRLWTHRSLWLNDPDCLLVRDSETALTLDQVRALATAIGMTDGMILLSDDMTRLPEERLDVISRFLPPLGRAAVALDFFESDIPSVLEIDCGTHRLLAVFNWGDSPVKRTLSLPDKPAHVFEFWSEHYLGVATGELAVTTPAEGCSLLALRPVLDRPQIVGSTFHFGQGALEVESESWDGAELALSLRPAARRDGKLFVHVPDGWRLRPGEAPPRADDRADGVLALDVRLHRPQSLSLTFDPVR